MKSYFTFNFKEKLRFEIYNQKMGQNDMNELMELRNKIKKMDQKGVLGSMLNNPGIGGVSSATGKNPVNNNR